MDVPAADCEQICCLHTSIKAIELYGLDLHAVVAATATVVTTVVASVIATSVTTSVGARTRAAVAAATSARLSYSRSDRGERLHHANLAVQEINGKALFCFHLFLSL